ncbi:hypothetical protein AV521_00810 [Streptomyces sp. IMTB 2501]|uniref:hypothetical protein n=1 Tax=Streptomyces sp. IMTB 2501 TaxID=1776340 RepID=UPI00096E5D6A|nr:hypothetical protein [Streptomyces sp. IMTB 2501]OLZ74264.1 hypothetical protein AV521_00810 [Streptomyces sp. IMTB 2501]
MIETRKVYKRDDVQIEVVYDTGTLSKIYLGVHTAQESFEVNLDRRDLPHLNHMVKEAFNQTNTTR